jgi:GT2 family glycosyltransferase
MNEASGRGKSMKQRAAGKANKAAMQPAPEQGFDEQTYLRLNPDVLMAVAEGKFQSGQEHYEHYGRAEGRLATTPGGLPRDRIIITARPGQTQEVPRAPHAAVDYVYLSSAGGLYVSGWVDDSLDRLETVELYVAGWSVAFSAAGLVRVMRPDADEVAKLRGTHATGFWGFIYAAQRLPLGKCNAVLRLKSGVELAFIATIAPMDDMALRDLMLKGITTAPYLGPRYFAASAALGEMIGEQLADFNRMLTRRAVSAPYVERFHQPGRTPKASIIVCLYGKPDYLPLQIALFARQAGMEAYEFIYVSNSPEMAEAMQRCARIAHLTYGLDITLILLSTNAGFAAANNLAATHARTGRLLFVNPDVFPKEEEFARRHLALLQDWPTVRTDLFGAALYYDDGTLMHGGMYLEADTLPGFALGRKQDSTILRVEHYGKGAPGEEPDLLRCRPVPAVTGAFISTERGWFETLDGFSEDYIFGHYEDADLCLRALEAGRPAWMTDLRLYHLEGKGGVHLALHEGAATVNRVLFTNSWLELAEGGLLGVAPEHPALRETAS